MACGWLPPFQMIPFQGSSSCSTSGWDALASFKPLPALWHGWRIFPFQCSHTELPSPSPPSLAPPPALGQLSSKAPSSAKHTELRDPRDAGGARVFHYSPACEIPLGTQLSADFPLASNIFAEGCQKVKEFSRRKAPLVHISRCKWAKPQHEASPNTAFCSQHLLFQAFRGTTFCSLLQPRRTLGLCWHRSDPRAAAQLWWHHFRTQSTHLKAVCFLNGFLHAFNYFA